MGQLTDSEIAFLKQHEVGDTVKTKFSYNHNKRQIGTNSFGKRLTFTTLDYIILDVEKNGFIRLSHDNKKSNSIIINPSKIKGVN